MVRHAGASPISTKFFNVATFARSFAYISGTQAEKIRTDVWHFVGPPITGARSDSAVNVFPVTDRRKITEICFDNADGFSLSAAVLS